MSLTRVVIMPATANEDAIALLKAVLKIPSVSGQEQSLSTYLVDFLKKHDFRVVKSKVGNAIGVKGSGKPILLLGSHMDTVPTNNPYCEDGDKIKATGAVDCKSSLAAMFAAGSQSPWKAGEGTLILAGLVHEEDALFGLEDMFLSLDAEHLVPDYAIFGEPTLANQICVGYRGRVLVKLKATADPGHSACAWDYDNAIEIVMEIYNQVKAYANAYNALNQKEKGHFDELSPVITTIHAGTVNNTLPDSCESEFDVRIPPGIKAEEVWQKIQAIVTSVQKMLAGHAATKVKAECMFCYDAVESDPQSPVLSALRWAGFKAVGEKIGLVKKTGSTFTNLIQAHYGKINEKFSCITYGPCDPRLEHTNREEVSITEYLQVVESYLKFFPKLSQIDQVQTRNKLISG